MRRKIRTVQGVGRTLAVVRGMVEAEVVVDTDVVVDGGEGLCEVVSRLLVLLIWCFCIALAFFRGRCSAMGVICHVLNISLSCLINYLHVYEKICSPMLCIV
jgi:hypothetical protein